MGTVGPTTLGGSSIRASTQYRFLLETEAPFTRRRIGMYNGNGKGTVFDVEGEALRDDNTSGFLAGDMRRDVTRTARKTSRIKAADEELFKPTCDSMPQLVWAATPEGSDDFFDNRWYRYTRFSEEESLGLGWRNPFHPDDTRKQRGDGNTPPQQVTRT